MVIVKRFLSICWMIAFVSSAADLPVASSVVSKVKPLQELVQDAIFNDDQLCNVVLHHMNAYPESAPLLAKSLSYALSNVFRQRYPVEINTPKMVRKEPTLLKGILKGHACWTHYMLAHDEDMISLKSDEGILMISSSISGRPKHMLVGHTGRVSCVIMHGDVIVSGGDEICIWNGKTYELQHVIKEGRNRLRCAMSDGNLYAGFPVSRLLSHNGDIIAGSLDGTVSIFDGTAYRLKAVLQSIDAYPLCGVQTLIAHEGDIVVTHGDGVLRVWEMPSLPYGDNPMALKYALLHRK